jgi:hypothetical protein
MQWTFDLSVNMRSGNNSELQRDWPGLGSNLVLWSRVFFAPDVGAGEKKGFFDRGLSCRNL